ncbi:MAG: SprT family zinc-dependent metalloprotease [Alphaproteobacteria bacterium]
MAKTTPALWQATDWNFLPDFLRAAQRPKTRRDETGLRTVGTLQNVPYKIVRNPRRKRTLSLSIEGKTIRVAAPPRVSRRVVESFIDNHALWIARHLDKASPTVGAQFVDGARISYLGYSCLLCVTQDANAAASCRLAPRLFRVHVHGEGLAAESLAQEVRLEIMLWLKKRALVKLQRRLDLWATRLNVRYRRMAISNPQRRWGSCSARDIIRLNWRLIMTPLPLLDYVVAHELCHIVHKNHGGEFWCLLASVMPDYRDRRRQLRKIEGSMAL